MIDIDVSVSIVVKTGTHAGVSEDRVPERKNLGQKMCLSVFNSKNFFPF